MKLNHFAVHLKLTGVHCKSTIVQFFLKVGRTPTG